MISDQQNRQPKPLLGRVKTFYVYGEGVGPNGIASGFCWLKEDTRKHQLKWMAGLTKEKAEYRGLIGALEYVGDGSTVDICMGSAEVAHQFNYPFPSMIHI